MRSAEGNGMRKFLPLPLLAALVALAVPAAPAGAAAAAEKLSVGQARQQIRTATENWAGLLDGQAHVGSCEHGGERIVRCVVVIKSNRTRCQMQVTVVRGRSYDSLRARSVRCADA
jgi:hypothetical protein